jgi:ComF family protein
MVSLFYPELCAVCRSNLRPTEQVICIECRHELPYTAFHRDPANPMARQLWGRFAFESAAALVYFHKGSSVQGLIHQLKYRSKANIGECLGELYGRRLSAAGGYRIPDIIVPVPLHVSKQKKRGYNQSESFARGLSRSLGIPISSGNLLRRTATETQTRKTRFMRFRNVEDMFVVRNPEEFEGKHIVVADDVMTTGATVESCSIELLKIKNTRISILTIAFAE